MKIRHLLLNPREKRKKEEEKVETPVEQAEPTETVSEVSFTITSQEVEAIVPEVVEVQKRHVKGLVRTGMNKNNMLDIMGSLGVLIPDCTECGKLGIYHGCRCNLTNKK